MASIGEQIIAARKAKGMTQDELSQALNISRSAVSQWERGRRMPDAGTLLKLSAILDYRFTGEAEMPPEGDAQQAEPTLGAAASLGEAEGEAPRADGVKPLPDQAEPAKKRPWIMLCATAVVVLCAVLLIVPALKKHRAADVPPTGADVDAATVTKAFFQQDNVNTEGLPFLYIDSTLKTQKNDSMELWLYTLSYHEKNGHAFHIDRLEAYTFVGDKVHPVVLARDAIEAQGIAVDIPANGDWSFDGGLPVQDTVSGIGFVLRGADDAGEALSFVFYQPLVGK